MNGRYMRQTMTAKRAKRPERFCFNFFDGLAAYTYRHAWDASTIRSLRTKTKRILLSSNKSNSNSGAFPDVRLPVCSVQHLTSNQQTAET